MTIFSGLFGRLARVPRATPVRHRTHGPVTRPRGLGILLLTTLLASGLPGAVAGQQLSLPDLTPVSAEWAPVDSVLSTFLQDLPVHPGVDRELARYEGGGLSPDYRADFARVARERVEARLQREVAAVREQGCSDRTWVEFPGKRFSGLPSPDGTRDGFENSLVLSGLVACYSEASDPESVLALYVSPETRMGAQSRLKEVFQRDGLTCYRVDGVPLLLSASLACNDVHRVDGPVAVEHSQSVLSEVDGKQPVYYKESVKVAFPTRGGVALVHVNLSRTTGLNGLEKRVGRGAIEDTLRRQAEIVAEALGAPVR